MLVVQQIRAPFEALTDGVRTGRGQRVCTVITQSVRDLLMFSSEDKVTGLGDCVDTLRDQRDATHLTRVRPEEGITRRPLLAI